MSAYLVLGIHSNDFLKKEKRDEVVRRFNENTGEPYEKVISHEDYRVGATRMARHEWRLAQSQHKFVHEDYGTYWLYFYDVEYDEMGVWGVRVADVSDEEIKAVDLLPVHFLRAELARFFAKYEIPENAIKLYLVKSE